MSSTNQKTVQKKMAYEMEYAQQLINAAIDLDQATPKVVAFACRNLIDEERNQIYNRYDFSPEFQKDLEFYYSYWESRNGVLK